jgi:sulfur-carrier protein
MTEVTIKLFATLRDGRFSIESRELQPGTTVGMVVQELGIPERDAALILVNGRHADIVTELREGDTLAIFPPIGGG